MRVVAAVCLLLVCSVVAPSAVLAETSGHDGRLAAMTADPVGHESDVDGGTAAVQSANESNTSNSSDDSLGLQVSSFVQSTNAETSGVVENEMWEANVNRSGRSADVTQRVDRLDRRVSTLREQREELVRAHENGDISTLRYRAELARLNGQLDALSAATESTERAATRLNTDAPGLSKVKTDIEQSRESMPATGRSAENPGQGNGSQASEGNPGNGDERSQRGSDSGPSTGANESADGTTTDESPGQSGGKDNANGSDRGNSEQDASDSGNAGDASGGTAAAANDGNSSGNANDNANNDANSGNTATDANDGNSSGNANDANSGNAGGDADGAGEDASDESNSRSSVLVHL